LRSGSTATCRGWCPTEIRATSTPSVARSMTSWPGTVEIFGSSGLKWYSVT
jgi:hypothetical protein